MTAGVRSGLAQKFAASTFADLVFLREAAQRITHTDIHAYMRRAIKVAAAAAANAGTHGSRKAGGSSNPLSVPTRLDQRPACRTLANEVGLGPGGAAAEMMTRCVVEPLGSAMRRIELSIAAAASQAIVDAVVW